MRRRAALRLTTFNCCALVAGAVLLQCTAVVAAQTEEPAARSVDFSRQVQPILAKRCFACHGPDTAESGLRLNRRETATAELDSGSRAIVPGKPEQSAIIERITAEDESIRMPPEEKPLSKEEIAVIREWIAGGAEWEQHWAFQPVNPQAPPAVSAEDADWVRTPIDAFILAKLRAHGLHPAPPADNAALLRRVYYDLTGLPPTPEEVRAFLEDESPNAWEQVVDRLLKSPRYGERWARDWLDLVRFAETNSFERDGLKPNAWRYRDYVIRSFNADKPYDQFIREQLAGDELDEVTTETIIATGYYRLGIWDDEPADPLQARYDEFDDIIRTTGEVFLGLTIGCARCHDHKIDPVPQTDYYSFLAFFRDLTTYGTRADQRTNSQTDISPPEVREAYVRLERAMDELREQMTPIEQRGIVKMSAEDQRKTEGPERQDVLREKLREYLDEADWAQYSELKERLRDLRRGWKELPPRESALSVAKTDPTPEPTHVLLRGNPHVEGEEVRPAFPSLFAAPAPEIEAATDDAESAGRRRVLADWIASPENMLTARVMANRIWQHHFGRGLVRSPNNFGQLGEAPTHPELLDWLAAEFVRLGWRMKPLHKLIVMSSAYQMSSGGDAAALAADPRNDLFWRFDMRRLSAEEIRDSIHAVNGRLNLEMYGPGFYPEISEEVLAGQSMPGSGWGKSSAEERARRSIYIHVKRSLLTPILVNFDLPEPDISCEARFVTTQPSQALGMLNGEFVNEQAKHLADRLRREAGDDPAEQVALAIRLALCREPEAADVERGLRLIETLRQDHGVSADEALDYYCLMVLNLNEFVYLD